MDSEIFLSTGDVCDLLSTKENAFPRGTLDNWVEKGMIRPVAGGNGTGNHRVFRLLPDVLAIAIGRGLRGQGYTHKVAGDVMQAILNYDAKTLLKKFAKGECCLMLLNDQVIPELFNEDTIDDTIKKKRPDILAMGLRPSRLDLKFWYDKLLTHLETTKKARSESVNPVEVMA